MPFFVCIFLLPHLLCQSPGAELGHFYNKQKFRLCRGAVDLPELVMDNNLSEIFSETLIFEGDHYDTVDPC